MQTQDSNPKVLSGEIPKYTGIMDCFKRVHAEQGMGAFWRGNLVNCIRYAPQQGSALAFNDAIKRAFPKYNPKTLTCCVGQRLRIWTRHLLLRLLLSSKGLIQDTCRGI